MIPENTKDKERSNLSASTAQKRYFSSPTEERTEGLKKMPASQRPFSKTNIWMMLGCVAMIVIGFALMSGGGSSVEGGFNPDIFSTRRIVVGPAIAFLGFLLMAFAIIYTPRSRRASKQE